MFCLIMFVVFWLGNGTLNWPTVMVLFSFFVDNMTFTCIVFSHLLGIGDVPAGSGVPATPPPPPPVAQAGSGVWGILDLLISHFMQCMLKPLLSSSSTLHLV